MSELRQKIPSVTRVLLAIHENPDDTRLGECKPSENIKVAIIKYLMYKCPVSRVRAPLLNITSVQECLAFACFTLSLTVQLNKYS